MTQKAIAAFVLLLMLSGTLVADNIPCSDRSVERIRISSTVG